MSTPPKHSPSFKDKDNKDNKDKDREKPRQDIGYYRVLGIQKDKNSLSNSTASSSFSKYDKLPSPSFNPMNIFSGEKKEDRVTRVKLTYYKQLLQADIKLAQKSHTSHEGRRQSLQAEFEQQHGQLARWGLQSLIRSFRMQSWLRQSRGELLMNMTKHIISTLQAKLAEVVELQTFLNGRGKAASQTDMRKKLDAITDSFYSSPEVMLERDKDFLKKRQRLSAVDKLCHIASTNFRGSLPELNSKDFAGRSRTIASIVKRFAALLDAKHLCMDSEIAVSSSWGDFCQWFEQKTKKELALYDEFLQFIDDEREREGRLFRRWCSLVRGSHFSSSPPSGSCQTGEKPEDWGAEGGEPQQRPSGEKQRGASASSGDNRSSSIAGNDTGADRSSSNSSNSSGGKSGMGGGAGSDGPGHVEANAAHIVHPRCIQVFIRYFAINIVAGTYNAALPPALHSALLALTESVVHRTVHTSLLRYPSTELRLKDLNWRKHALRCRRMDPLQYHTHPKYLGIRTPSSSLDNDKEPSPLTALELHLAAVLDGTDMALDNSSAVGCSTTSNVIDNSSMEPSSPPSASTLPALREEAESYISRSDAPPSTPYISRSDAPPSTPPPRDARKNILRSSSLGSIPPPRSSSSSSPGSKSRSLRLRPPSGSSSSLAALGGRTARCEAVLRGMQVRPLHGRLGTILANSLDKADSTDEGATQPLMVDFGLRNGIDGRKMVALYALPARVLGQLQLAVCPRDAVVVILLAVQWLTRTAGELLRAAGRHPEALGADDMFPLLVNVLAQANIPCIHLILCVVAELCDTPLTSCLQHYLTSYTAVEAFGEAAYYVTSMNAAVEFIDTTFAEEGVSAKDGEQEEDQEAPSQEELSQELRALEEAKGREKEQAEAAVAHLGEWLRDQQVMEDTMVVMMQEGWMG